MSAADNIARALGRRGRYEVWYLTFNHRPSGAGFWIRYTTEWPTAGEPYGQLWFACFDRADPGRTVAFNRRFPMAAVEGRADPFAVAIAGAELGHDRARGALEGAGHRAAWDLAWTPAPETWRHLPDMVYRSSLPDTLVLSPNPDVRLTGSVEVDGRTLRLEDEPGGQTHLWGRKHAHAWAWGRCNAFAETDEAYLETLTVRVRRLGVVLPALTFLSLRLRGAEHRFTGLLEGLRGRGEGEGTRYAFRAGGGAATVSGFFSCRRDDMVEARYHDPDGDAAFCANTEVGDLSVVVRTKAGEEHLTGRGTAHFEVGGREPFPGPLRPHLTATP